MRNMQSVPSTDSRFIQAEEKIFEELGLSSQMWFTPRKEVGCSMEAVAHAGMYYFLKLMLFLSLSKCILKFANLPIFFCITIFFASFGC